MAEQTCLRDPAFEPISNDNDIDRYILLGSVQPKGLNWPSTTVFEQCSEHCSNTEDFLKQRKSSIKRSAYYVGGGGSRLLPIEARGIIPLYLSLWPIVVSLFSKSA